MSADFKVGDLVFHTRRKKFGFVITRPRESVYSSTGQLMVRIDVSQTPGTSIKDAYGVSWFCDKLIKVETDTPENRLLINLKYA